MPKQLGSFALDAFDMTECKSIVVTPAWFSQREVHGDGVEN